MNIKKAIWIAVLTAMAVGPSYWFLRGLLTMETLAVRGGSNGPMLISATAQPGYFWTTLALWGFIGIAAAVALVFAFFQLRRTKASKTHSIE